MTTPEPVPASVRSPEPFRTLTEMFTTDCSTLAAMPATDSGARLSVDDVDEPVPRLAEGSVSEPLSACRPATYPAVPPATRATASDAPTAASSPARFGTADGAGPPIVSVGYPQAGAPVGAGAPHSGAVVVVPAYGVVWLVAPYGAVP